MVAWLVLVCFLVFKSSTVGPLNFCHFFSSWEHICWSTLECGLPSRSGLNLFRWMFWALSLPILQYYLEDVNAVVQGRVFHPYRWKEQGYSRSVSQFTATKKEDFVLLFPFQLHVLSCTYLCPCCAEMVW